MAFEDLKKDELLEIAEAFAVDVNQSDTKKVIAAALVEEGVTPEQVEKFRVKEEDAQEANDTVQEQDEAEVADEPKQRVQSDGKEVVVKMERKNLRFDAGGYTFRREHPYAVMTEEEAQRIFDMHDGFRLANPREVEDYYG